MKYIEYIRQDIRMNYYRPFSKGALLDRILCSEQYYLRRYVLLLRSEEYYTFICPDRIRRMYYSRKKNRLGVRLGFFIPAGCFGSDLKIAHYGSIIVNPHSRIGRGCTIHGNCCIGNKGLEPSEHDSPTVGNNVNIGQGAQILGPVRVADGVNIGAGAVVVKDIEISDSKVVGIPARII